MTIGTAVFLAFALLFGTIALFIILVFGFLLMVYLKEYKREDKAISELIKQQKDSYAGLGGLPVVYLDVPVAAAPKKKKAAATDLVVPTKDDKDKNNIN